MKNYFPGTSQFLPFMKRVPRKMTRRRLKIDAYAWENIVIGRQNIHYKKSRVPKKLECMIN